MAGKPKLEANNISVLLNQVLGEDRFPVDVDRVAREYSSVKFPDQKISDIIGSDLPGFEGMLVKHPTKNKWKIIYNNSQPSEGRVRFTLAHEFGHYILHRNLQSEFSCSKSDVKESDISQPKNLEFEADVFAATLLMPLDDFRKQTAQEDISISLIQHCANRYGVSLMAAALRLREIAKERVVILTVKDGFVDWAVSNEKAYKSGLVLPSRKRTIAVPAESLVNSNIWTHNGSSKVQKAQVWFPKESSDTPLVEHVFHSGDSFNFSLVILVIPDNSSGYSDYSSLKDEQKKELSGHLTHRK